MMKRITYIGARSYKSNGIVRLLNKRSGFDDAIIFRSTLIIDYCNLASCMDPCGGIPETQRDARANTLS